MNAGYLAWLILIVVPNLWVGALTVATLQAVTGRSKNHRHYADTTPCDTFEVKR